MTDDHVGDLIKDRGNDYGPYAENSKRLATVLTALDVGRIARSHPDQFYAMVMVATKLCRLSYKPDHDDSWNDIAAYARLAVEGDGRSAPRASDNLDF